MTRRTRKPPIKPEKRLEWVKRVEQGETPPHIAEADHVDVRTVRKHVELARMERDIQEARSSVLRNALEGHYRDLLEIAQDIQTRISQRAAVSMEQPLILGLRQHMPRSPLWENLRKWNQTLRELAELENALPQKVRDGIEEDGRLGGIVSHDENEVIPAAVDVLVHQMRQWVISSKGLLLERNFRLEKASEGRVRVIYGFSHFGEIDESQALIIKNVIADFELKLKQWPEYLEMEKLVNRLSRSGNAIREPVTVILLRRIVPGRCKYCPL
jgi:hypothetical protein